MFWCVLLCLQNEGSTEGGGSEGKSDLLLAVRIQDHCSGKETVVSCCLLDPEWERISQGCYLCGLDCSENLPTLLHWR